MITEKLLSSFVQVCILNMAAVAVTCACIFIVDVDADAATLALVFLAHLILQLEIVCLTFGISAFLRRGELGVRLGLVFAAYFLNILANLTEELKFLKYVSPFSYTDGVYIIPEKSNDVKYLAVGLALSALGIAVAYWKYTKKDIA